MPVLKKETSLIFKIIKCLVRLFYGKMEIVGIENLPSDNTIIVGNHCQMNGPIAGELFLPKNCYTWCAGQMMHLIMLLRTSGPKNRDGRILFTRSFPI